VENATEPLWFGQFYFLRARLLFTRRVKWLLWQKMMQCWINLAYAIRNLLWRRQKTELSFLMSDKGFKAHLFHCTCFHWRQHFFSKLHSFVCSTLDSDARRSSLTVTQPPGVHMTTTTIGMALPQMRRQQASVLFHLGMTCSPSKSSSQTTNPI
jgi:hypothetical protein